ncbi:hypothetical protein GCM10008106_37820 [Mongoliitalea lutea]|uniref:Uncharacterized protein n=1 Tax=Mongoliitalea lutea TaxID=849756 RepID=A0A8J3G8A4_9BACT|nr:hypothetical protein GCM10008106_37820 [Mongoliitalea lutea]
MLIKDVTNKEKTGLYKIVVKMGFVDLLHVFLLDRLVVDNAKKGIFKFY